MKYKCIRGYRQNGNPVNPGDIVEVSEREALPLMFYGKLVPLAEETAQTREPVVEHRDPEVKRRGRPPRGG